MKITNKNNPVEIFFVKILYFAQDFLFSPNEEEKVLRNITTKDLESFKSYESCTLYGNKIYYCFSYKNKIIKELIWQIKFRGKKKYSDICGEILCEYILNILKSDHTIITHAENFNSTKNNTNSCPILIPVPIHKKRRVERGFNQCEWLCESIKEYDSKNILNYNSEILIRNKYQTKQSWINKKERMNNLKNSFYIKDPKAIKNKDLIIIDDVCTTGSTIKEICQTLKKSGINSITIFTIAH